MRIDLPTCGFKNCRFYFDGNYKNRIEYEHCEYARLKNYIYYVGDESQLKSHKANADRIKESVERTKKYLKE